MTKLGNVLKGVAIGDAYGNPNEFRSIAALTKDSPQGPDLPDDLYVTDDAQMTLYLATALETSKGQSMATVKATIETAFLNYYNDPLASDGMRSPGGTVISSLGRLHQGKKWQDATHPSSDGSGTVMRTSPCAFLPHDQWVGVTAFAAAVTHGSANAIAAAILDVALLRELLDGTLQFGELIERASILAGEARFCELADVGEWLDGYKVPGGLKIGFDGLTCMLNKAQTALRILKADPWAKDSDPSLHIGGGGWRGHETLAIALLAIDMLPDSPWLALRRSVTTNGDSDTIGAVTGALLGAGMGDRGPDSFNEAWDELESRFEPEYRDWINEAEHYFSEAVVS